MCMCTHDFLHTLPRGVDGIVDATVGLAGEEILGDDVEYVRAEHHVLLRLAGLGVSG